MLFFSLEVNCHGPSDPVHSKAPKYLLRREEHRDISLQSLLDLATSTKNYAPFVFCVPNSFTLKAPLYINKAGAFVSPEKNEQTQE